MEGFHEKEVFSCITVLPTALAFTLAVSAVSFASPQSKPNGPYIEDNQNISLSSYMSNDKGSHRMVGNYL